MLGEIIGFEVGDWMSEVHMLEQSIRPSHYSGETECDTVCTVSFYTKNRKYKRLRS